MSDQTPIQQAHEVIEERHATLKNKSDHLSRKIVTASVALGEMNDEASKLDDEMGRLCVAIDTLAELIEQEEA